MTGVELGELPGHRRDVSISRRVRLDEQSPSHDLERLLTRRRTPLIRNAAHDVLQALQRFLPVRAADLDG